MAIVPEVYGLETSFPLFIGTKGSGRDDVAVVSHFHPPQSTMHSFNELSTGLSEGGLTQSKVFTVVLGNYVNLQDL